jgi:alanine-glyoxylate transaminase/serine-glyoxylate transaminase/serine-pyruvate transaminase
MPNRLESLEKILLMGPGPSMVHSSVYAALAKDTIGHMDSSFIALMDDIKEQLRTLCQTGNLVTLPMSGTGSAGMETCFVNLVEPGDQVLILQNGVFGVRMADVAERLGAKVEVLKFEWGSPVVPDEAAKALGRKKYSLVAVVHAETSTGVRNPVEAIGPLVKENGALYLVDGVTSLGGIEVALDRWGVDAFYSGTQKCLSCPPGLAPVSLSEAALAKLRNRRQKVPNWYLDLTLIINYWEGNSRVYHHTAPINMNYALYQALRLLLEEGTDKVFGRHQAAHDQLGQGLESLGFTLPVEKAFRLPMLNAVTPPPGVDEAKLRQKLRREYLIEVGSGLGPLAGKIIRIGLMGETARRENVSRLLDALRECLSGS